MKTLVIVWPPALLNKNIYKLETAKLQSNYHFHSMGLLPLSLLPAG